MARRRADRPGRAVALRLAPVACAFVLAVTGCGRSSGTSGASAREPSRSGSSSAAVAPGAGSTYTLMQMNLCLSGRAGCYGRVAYPAGVEEAVARIREARPDAVTVNEGCRNDVALIARR